ncbi:hypothetical protein [Dactylosporangium sp. NPDC005555]|uniref:hypothetical protein n=1 Tax=Dactylosporangium sp. NPDC005555 TaxID=3154889 RepID=UPI0033A4D789
MRRARLAAVAVAAATATSLFPAAADAATIDRPFAANSGDSCPYGVTAGTLGWSFGPGTSPLPPNGVTVTGRLTDHPTPVDPSTACRNDGYSSTVTFTAYTTTGEVARTSRTADNANVSFSFTIGGPTSTVHVGRIVVQVCRNPVVTTPPSYCGPAVTYLPPPVA